LVEVHILLPLVASPLVAAGVIKIIRLRQWYGFVRYVYDQENAHGRTVDALRLLQLAKESGTVIPVTDRRAGNKAGNQRSDSTTSRLTAPRPSTRDQS
jgi:hypothetical protein